MTANNEELLEGKFELKKKTKISDLVSGKCNELPESDLTIQDDSHILQFNHIDPEDVRGMATIKTGCFTIEQNMTGTFLKKFKLRKNNLLETIDNTRDILSESNKFFKKVDSGIYKNLSKEPRRSILLYSNPGMGKSAAIARTCENFLEQKDTAVVIWDTANIESSPVNKFFLQGSKFSSKVKRMIFVIEDIGGGSVEENYGPRGADSSLLNLLDGVGSPFKGVPTFIIATTNNPEQSVEPLIDRPGRFDKVIEMKAPDRSQAVELLKFISKRELLPTEIEAAALAAKNNFSIAHLQEIVVRSLIDDITMYEATEQLVKHKTRFKEAFVQKPAGNGGRSIGFGSH